MLTSQLWLPAAEESAFYKKKINLSIPLAGQAVGIKEVDDGIYLASDLSGLYILKVVGANGF